jgi:conserved oligomeric Golgi complex subunit 5
MWRMQVKGVAPAVTEAQAEALLAAAAPFRDAYLSATLARLNEAVGAAFPGGSRPLPTAVDLQKCIGYV